MFDRWTPPRRYNLLRSADDSVGVPNLPSSAHYSEWFAIRRVRTTFAISALLLVAIPSLYLLKLASHGLVPSEMTDDYSTVTSSDEVRWSDFAYAQYVTNRDYLCNSLMILEALQRSGTKADRIMMYPENWEVPEGNSYGASIESKLLVQARDSYGAKLVPIQVQTFAKGDATWKDSYTKLLAFNQTQYKRVMSLDSDATVRKHMDELFLLPSSPVAMPRAYWLDQPFLSSQLVLVEPSAVEWHRVQEFMSRDESGFDMDILNSMYKDFCIVIPHKRYNLLSGEFRSDNHEKYLGFGEAWEGVNVLEDAKFVHFSDWPVPKPWLVAPGSVMKDNQPKCRETKDGGQPDCRDRDIWLELYNDFTRRRQRICGHIYGKRQLASLDVFVPTAPPRYEMVLP